ncbi:energy transducer TonB [Dysgonomonas macrotermitis]|uniref:TonB protein C-terminal n=1 Tax=Dysgonomonas macrotermitis TaxID=1346286 RepID=A0A1M5G5D3_9BACT|nr:energy transducer TonB [Dysgonomonas macrotermitis]SHF98919.1 TonB protein C-terminal [Dysgonomonas macrotermitis]
MTNRILLSGGCFLFILLYSCSSERIIIRENRTTVEKSCPQFQGGEKGYKEFFEKNVHYPASLSEKKLFESVYINCYVDKNGSIIRAVTSSIFDNVFDKEVKRALDSLPEFVPGPANNSKNVVYILPVNFSIPEADNQEKRPFILHEIRSQFPGGNEEFQKYLLHKLKYRLADKMRNKKGKIAIHFFVDKIGEIKEAKVVDSFSSAYSKQVLEILNGMPRWIPGCGNCKGMEVIYRLTISYNIDWKLIYPVTRIESYLESFSFSGINKDALPEGFLDDVFDKWEKVTLDPVNIIGKP